MAAMLADAYTGVMNTLLFKLSKLLEDQEYAKIKGVVRNQVTFLRDELSSMKPVLEMLADAEELDPLKKEWRDTVRELAYDIEDYIDSFMVNVNHDHDKLPKGFKGFFRKLKKLKARHEIADLIEELKTCAIDASDRSKNYSIVDARSNSCISGSDPRMLSLYEEVDKLVGIDNQKKHIIDWSIRERDDKNLKVLTVVDSVGLGKATSLAAQVYYELVENQFQFTAFVSASQNICTLLRSILIQVGIIDKTSDDELLIRKIRYRLRDKRYLIVVDDVQDGETWKAIKLALFNINRCGSRIIITTINAAVASCCSSYGAYIYQLEPLSFDDSKRLCFKRAFGSEDLPYSHLEAVSEEILRKCGGLPLAIILISSLLADQHGEDEWKKVLSTISGAFFANNDLGFESIMRKIFSLSFLDLPRHLRTCLLYLSIFPKDHEINKQHLINRWIAEGFIQEEQGHSKYEVGECYFNFLINKGFIQPVGVKYGQAKACRVSSNILGFIICQASEENFFTSFHDEHGPVSEHTVRVRRLFVDNRNKREAARLRGLSLSHVRSLTIFGELTGTSFMSFPALRVLDLDQGEMNGLAHNLEFGNHQMTNIEKLLHLRYLRLRSSDINLKLTRGIGKLQHLEILDLKNAIIVELPPAITKLHRLSRLYVSRFVRFPDGAIGKMHSLEELNAFGVRSYGVWSYEQVKKSLQEFSQLTKLRTLTITWEFDWSFCQDEEDLQSHMQNLISSCNLRHLYITNTKIFPAPYPLSLESCGPATSCSLRKLHITYCFVSKLPNWVSSLGNLRELKLYIYCITPEDVEILGAMPSLVFLKLKTFYGSSGRILVPGYKGFRCLKYFALVMMSCGTALEFEAGSMPELEHLKLRFCLHKVDCLNGASDFGIQHLSTIKVVEVYVYGCLTDHKDYNPEGDTEESNLRSVTSRIKVAVVRLPNRPACSFQLATNYGRLGPFHGLTEILNQYNDVSVETLVQEILKLSVKQLIRDTSFPRF